MDVVDASIDQRVQDVFENRTGSSREHRFGPVGRQGAKPNSFASS
jgi:hypothetical protein